MSRLLDFLLAAHGQCRLTYVSTTQLKLSPYHGNSLNINGLPERIPSAGVTIANTGLAASTLYYVYAYMSGATMTLELSTTGHSTNDHGIEIKTGDATRTLVGMIRTNGSTPGQFLESSTDLCVLSYFNRKRKVGRNKFTANRTKASGGAFSEIHSEIRVNFITWGDEYVRQTIHGGWAVTGVSVASGYCGIDGATPGTMQSWSTTTTNTTSGFASCEENLVSEGYHYGTLVGNCSSGTSVTFVGGQNGEVTQFLIVQG